MSHCFFHCRLERETCGSTDKDPQNLSTEPNPAYGHVNVTQEKEHIYDQLGVPHEDDGQCDAATSKLEEQ